MLGFVDLEAYLAALDEDELREVVVIPLLKALGYQEVLEYHGGSAEKGKDVICWYHDPTGEKRYVAILLKTTDIHGAVSRHGSAGEVLLQAEQALLEPYTDVFSLKSITVDEVWVVTSGRIKNTAVESIRGKLAKSGLERLVRFGDRSWLAGLIAKYMPTFWYSGRVLGHLFHELRRPLSDAMNALRRLEKAEPATIRAKVPELMLRLKGDLRELADLIDRTNLLSDDTFRVVLEPTDLARLLGQATEDLAPMASMEGVTIALRCSGVERSVELDRRLIRHVMHSLLHNAIRYSQPPASVEVLASQSAEETVVRVRDSGIGVPDADAHRIFRPFFRGRAAVERKPGGMGMSLYMAKKIAEGHGGDVLLVNLRNPTEFRLVLPFVAGVESKSQGTQEQPSLRGRS